MGKLTVSRVGRERKDSVVWEEKQLFCPPLLPTAVPLFCGGSFAVL